MGEFDRAGRRTEGAANPPPTRPTRAAGAPHTGAAAWGDPRPLPTTSNARDTAVGEASGDLTTVALGDREGEERGTLAAATVAAMGKASPPTARVAVGESYSGRGCGDATAGCRVYRAGRAV